MLTLNEFLGQRWVLGLLLKQLDEFKFDADNDVSDARLKTLKQLVGVFATQLMNFGLDRSHHVHVTARRLVPGSCVCPAPLVGQHVVVDPPDLVPNLHPTLPQALHFCSFLCFHLRPVMARSAAALRSR